MESNISKDEFRAFLELKKNGKRKQGERTIILYPI